MTEAAGPRRRFALGWYNGWSPDERRAATARQSAAVTRGVLSRPGACSICRVRRYRGSDNPVWFHDEDYADPLAAFAICRQCHRTLHERFEQPAPWRALLHEHGDGTRWFEALSMDAAALRQPFTVTYPNGPPHDQRPVVNAARSGSAD